MVFDDALFQSISCGRKVLNAIVQLGVCGFSQGAGTSRVICRFSEIDRYPLLTYPQGLAATIYNIDQGQHFLVHIYFAGLDNWCPADNMELMS